MRLPIIGDISIKPRNCLIRIHRAYNGSDTEELETYGYLSKDQETDTYRLEAKKYDINEPALPYKYFKKYSSKFHKGIFRVVHFYCPYPGYFLPVEHSFLETSGLEVLPQKKEQGCDYCKWEKENRNKKIKTKFSDYCSANKLSEVRCCKAHISKFIKAKFKVVPEERKEWYQQQIVKRAQRRTEVKKGFLESDAFKILLFCGLVLACLVLTYQLGFRGMESILEKTFESGAEMMREAMINGAKPPN